MANYMNKAEVTYKESDIFKPTFKPGTRVPRSGIYVCTNCRDEAACNEGDPFPPQNHRQHSVSKGAIEWQLLVVTQRGPD